MSLDINAQRFLAYFVTGWGTELGGRHTEFQDEHLPQPYQITHALTSGSAFSVGVLQTDFGKQPERLADFVAAYFNWFERDRNTKVVLLYTSSAPSGAYVHDASLLEVGPAPDTEISLRKNSDANKALLSSVLSQTGRAIGLGDVLKADLNKFLQTNVGMNLVDRFDHDQLVDVIGKSLPDNVLLELNEKTY